jgi:hypothetical protein
MRQAYLCSNVISFVVWAFLYYRRPDLRKLIVVSSLCALPLALFDLVYVPLYWKPTTLFNVPIGIEGFLFSFSVGGMAAALYPHISKRTPKHFNKSQISVKLRLAALLVPLVAFFVVEAMGVPNPEIAAYIAIGSGTFYMLALRRDLQKSALLGAIYFGIAYYLCLKLWVTLFPGVHHWFIFHGMPKVFVWKVPGWEALFGFFFGAYWVNIYAFLFEYRFEKHR